MATKQEIIAAIDSKIITKGNITAVDTNKILKDIVNFSDKPSTLIGSFDFGNLESPLQTDRLTVKVNFTGIEKFSCSLYLSIEARLQNQDNNDLEWLFVPIKEEEYKILSSFLPNINEKQMYLTFMVPFLRAEQKDNRKKDTSGTVTAGSKGDPAKDVKGNPIRDLTSMTATRSGFPMMVIGIGLLMDRNERRGIHIILPEVGHISTSMALSYKANEFGYDLFSKEMQKGLQETLSNIIENNKLTFD